MEISKEVSELGLPSSQRRRALKAGAAMLGASALGFPAIVLGQSDKIRIGHLTPLTGFLGALGEYAVMGIKMATDEINAAGGVLGRQLESHYLKEITQCLRMAFDADDLDLAFLNSWPYNHRDPGDKTIDRNNPLLLRFEVPLSKSTADSPVWAVDINEIVDSAIKIRSILIPQADPEEDDAQVKFLRSLSQAFRSLADKIDLSLED